MIRPAGAGVATVAHRGCFQANGGPPRGMPVFARGVKGLPGDDATVAEDGRRGHARIAEAATARLSGRGTVDRPASSLVWGYASSRIVMGPSLTSSTSMCAPKTPVPTVSPRSRSAATTDSTSGSATGPGAAPFHDGRRPFRTSA